MLCNGWPTNNKNRAVQIWTLKTSSPHNKEPPKRTMPDLNYVAKTSPGSPCTCSCCCLPCAGNSADSTPGRCMYVHFVNVYRERIHIYVYVYLRACVCIYIFIYVYTYTYIHIYICTYMRHIFICVYGHGPLSNQSLKQPATITSHRTKLTSHTAPPTSMGYQRLQFHSQTAYGLQQNSHKPNISSVRAPKACGPTAGKGHFREQLQQFGSDVRGRRQEPAVPVKHAEGFIASVVAIRVISVL